MEITLHIYHKLLHKYLVYAFYILRANEMAWQTKGDGPLMEDERGDLNSLLGLFMTFFCKVNVYR